MILCAATLRRLKPVRPFCERGVIRGRSYGLSVASYDIRVAESFTLAEGQFKLASSVEEFFMPKNVAGVLKDKSSWARVGLSVFNTFVDPGFLGYLTLELVNHGPSPLRIKAGDSIAQVIFQFTDRPTEGYKGKYNRQEAGPQKARYES